MATKKTQKAKGTRFKATKKLSFVRPNEAGGQTVIKAGATFSPDSTMDVDRMLKSGKIEEV